MQLTSTTGNQDEENDDKDDQDDDYDDDDDYFKVDHDDDDIDRGPGQSMQGGLSGQQDLVQVH